MNSRASANPDPEAVRTYLLELQDNISSALEEVERSMASPPPATFREDSWERDPELDSASLSGQGRARVLTEGDCFEKAGINFSDVSGPALPPSATARKPEIAGAPFRAMGVSLVFHPFNPYIPTTHANVRFFLAQPENHEPVWWFGGGFDLTPYYPFEEDVIHWHETAKAACEPFGDEIYPAFKRQCDEYFFLRHRKETRGVGGLFFDDYTEGGFTRAFALTRRIGDHFLPAYLPIIQRRRDIAFGDREQWFQEYRRSRYAEFNLVYDRGTLFGLQSGGRTESILMSMPPRARWVYNWAPTPGSPEADLYEHYLHPRDWLGEE